MDPVKFPPPLPSCSSSGATIIIIICLEKQRHRLSRRRICRDDNDAWVTLLLGYFCLIQNIILLFLNGSHFALSMTMTTMTRRVEAQGQAHKSPCLHAPSSPPSALPVSITVIHSASSSSRAWRGTGRHGSPRRTRSSGPSASTRSTPGT